MLPRADGYIPRGIELHEGTKAEPSGDQYTGILVGFDLTYRFVERPDIRQRIRDQANRIGQFMQDNSYFIFRPQGGLAARGANCVQWEYPWSQMLFHITGNRYQSSFSFSDFWGRLRDEDRNRIILITASVTALISASGLVWLAWGTINALIPNILNIQWILEFLRAVFTELLLILRTTLSAFGLAAGSVLILLLAFLIALFAVFGEDALGLILNFLHGSDARRKYRLAIGVLAGKIPKYLNQLADLIRRLEPAFPLVGEFSRYPVNYYNYHIAFLASFGAFFQGQDPEVQTLEELYEQRIVKDSDPETEEEDRNALFALMARTLFGRDDAFTRRAIQILDEPGVFPEENLPNTWDDSEFYNNYAWQKFPHQRREHYGDTKQKELPGLDYLFPTILRAHLENTTVPPGCSPAILEVL